MRRAGRRTSRGRTPQIQLIDVIPMSPIEDVVSHRWEADLATCHHEQREAESTDLIRFFLLVILSFSFSAAVDSSNRVGFKFFF